MRSRRVKFSSASSFLGSCAEGRAGVREAAHGGGFFWAGEGEVAGGEIRCVLQLEPIKSMVSGWFRGRKLGDPTIVNKIKGLRGSGGGKHAFYRSFRVDG